MIPFQRILLPTDFSDNSKSARDYACDFAHRYGAQLHVLNVVQDPALILPETGMFLTVPMPNVGELTKAAEEALEKILAPEWAASHDVVLHVALGTPYDEILRYAEEHHIDLIVVGTHGWSGLKHALLGSVAERVVRKAPCPVLTIHSTPEA